MKGSREKIGWLTPGVQGIRAASFLVDLGHEVPTALLPRLLTSPLGAPAAALGLIEGTADGAAIQARARPQAVEYDSPFSGGVTVNL